MANMAEFSKEGYGSKRASFPMMMILMMMMMMMMMVMFIILQLYPTYNTILRKSL
jgi:hypothetical protein